MPEPYRARVDVRRFLNFPGFHDGAYVVAYVEDTSERPIADERSSRSFPVDPIPRARTILEIADCSLRINLEFAVHSELQLANSLHKVDTLVQALTEFRAGLVEEGRIYRERKVMEERRVVARRRVIARRGRRRSRRR